MGLAGVRRPPAPPRAATEPGRMGDPPWGLDRTAGRGRQAGARDAPPGRPAITRCEPSLRRRPRQRRRAAGRGVSRSRRGSRSNGSRRARPAGPAATQTAGSGAALRPPCRCRSDGSFLDEGSICGHVPSRTFRAISKKEIGLTKTASAEAICGQRRPAQARIAGKAPGRGIGCRAGR